MEQPVIDHPVVSARNVTVRYPAQRHLAIDKISFDIASGTINTLLGPNGSGKSTVIKSILGFVDYEGEIDVLGRDVQEVYSQIGYVPQFKEFDASFPITVEEFIGYSLVNTKHPKDWREYHVRSVLKQVNSSNLYGRLIYTLSGGQLQRVLLARALVHNPRILILDEPEAGIDVGAEQNLYELILRLADEEDVTVIIASHELDVVYNYADRVICINQKKMCDGPPAVALKPETFEELYGKEIKLYGHHHN